MTETGQLSSVGRRIIRAGVVVVIAQGIFKVASILQAMVMAPLVDRGVYDVVVAFGFENCIFTFFMIGEEVIAPCFLPVFMREMDTKGERAAWQFANVVVTVQMLILLLAALLIMLFPDAVIGLLTAWKPGADAAKYELGRRSLIWLAPSLIGLSLGSTTYMLLNGYKRFFLAALGDASWKFCCLLCVLIGMGWFGMDYRALIFGLLAGSVAKVATHLAGLLRELRFFRPSLNISNPAVKSMFLLMLPLIVGIVFAKVRDVYNNVTVLTYLDTEGLMMANSLGRKLSSTLGWIVPYALSIALFPFFCEMVDKNEKDKLGELLSRSARMLLSVFIPLACVCVVLAKPVTALLLERGKFTADMTDWTAVSMACYALVLPAQALEYLLMKAFFAHRRMVAITAAGIVFSALSMAISYAGIRLFGAHGGYALAVVALSLTVTRTLKSAALVWMLKRDVPFFPPAETAVFLAKAVLAGIVSAAACYGANVLFDLVISSSHAKWFVLARLTGGATAAACAFLLSVVLLRLSEPMEMVSWAYGRIRERVAR